MLAFAEACIGIGLFVSGILLVAVCTVIYSTDMVRLEVIVVLAWLGATLGDQFGFWVGCRLGPRFHHTGLAEKHREKLQRAEAMIVRFGSYAVFIGRFIPAIRSIIPAMLGISGFTPARYLLLDVCACLLWAMALAMIVLGAEYFL